MPMCVHVYDMHIRGDLQPGARGITQIRQQPTKGAVFSGPVNPAQLAALLSGK